MKNLIKEFNTKDALIVISSYPQKQGEPALLNAVACYTGNLLHAYRDRKIIVLCEITSEAEMYRRGNLLIARCYRRGSPLLYLDLIKALLRFNQPRQILLQFEFNMLGQTPVTTLLPIFLAAVKLSGRRLSVVLHQVVEDLGTIGGHLGLTGMSLKRTILNRGLKSFYIATGMLSDRIVVHEQTLKNRLAHMVNAEKIDVISHGLSLDNSEEVRPLRRGRTSRQKLGLRKDEFVLLLFGYITWYKGVDWLIQKVGKLAQDQPKLKLLIAGGPSATLRDKPHYQAFLRKVERLSKRYRRSVRVTGFIPENQVRSYFAAADLVVLPYRSLISASGPLSFALRFAKPILLSKALAESLENPDVRTALEQCRMQPEDLMFSLSGNDFAKKIESLVAKRGRLNRLSRASIALRELRSWETIVGLYEATLAKEPKASILVRLVQSLARPTTDKSETLATES